MRGEQIYNMHIKMLYDNIVRNLIIFGIIIAIVTFINHSILGNDDLTENYTMFSMADVKDYILDDYKDSETVYYKLINTDDNRINIVTWDELSEKATVYRYTVKKDNNLQFDMVFTSDGVELDTIKDKYDGVMK